MAAGSAEHFRGMPNWRRVAQRASQLFGKTVIQAAISMQVLKY